MNDPTMETLARRVERENLWCRCITVVVLAGLAALLGACSNYTVDTIPEWCEKIAGVSLVEKYQPWWAVIFAVSFDEDSIRDDYVADLNSVYMEKVQNRAPRMVWRENTDLHVVNLSSLLVIEPEKFIDKWRDGIEKAKTFSHADPESNCLIYTVTILFDNLIIHSMTNDTLGEKWKDSVTTIPTERDPLDRVEKWIRRKAEGKEQ